ncbi:C40 family peptidase [Edaphovirga cremea]|uniref:C40 family peptidase n=1 Tax=Edaphovirga cremea TaxID=2267246 RepID=UPI003989E81D
MRNKTLQAIMAHAKQCYPQECCGVVAQKSRVERYFPCRNILPDNADEKRGPRYGFTIAPEDYANAEDWGTIAAIVHSHPDATTQPSEKDMAECDDSALPWHIVSWPEGDLRTIHPRGERPLVGRQFLLGHADCWGLIMSYFRQTHGIELKDYRVDYPWWEDGKKNFYMDNWFECGFREFTGATQKGDMAIMQVSAPVANHAGILVEDGMLLHHLYGHLSNRTPYGGYWLERTLKIVRHKDLF